MQLRLGPNRAGPQGLLQPIADAVKLLTKEDFIPAGADRVIFLYAPAVVAGTALLIFAVVPFARGWTFRGQEIPGVVSDLNVGLLFVLALSSLGVYGVALGGWASNSKFALLGAIRGAAQMISYELSLGLSLVPVVMLARSFSLVDIVQAQARFPFILLQPLAFLIFFISAVAEIKRIPFDLPGGGKRTGGRLSHGIQRHALRPLFSGGVRHHGDPGGPGGGLLPGRLAGAVAAAPGLVLHQGL